MRKRAYAPYKYTPGYRRKKSRKTKTISKASRGKLVPVKMSSFRAPSSASFAGSRFRASLIYAEKGISVNPGIGGTAGVYVFSLNGLFDPNVTGVGHQPVNYDQIMAIYEEYKVLSVKYKVSLINGNGQLAVLTGVTITDQSNTNSDPLVYMENGMTQFKTLTGFQESGPAIVDFSGQVYLADIHGKTNAEYMSDDVYRGLAGNNPNESAFLHIWAADLGLGDPAVVNIVITLEYDVIFTGGKLNALS